MKFLKSLFFLILLAALFIGRGWMGSASSEPFIRVAVLNEVSHFDLTLKGPAEIQNATANATLEEVHSLRRSEVAAVPEGIKIGNQTYPVDRLRIISSRVPAQVNDKRYRGQIDVIRTKERRLIVVNVLELEEYVRGILYHEMPHRWPLEALKVQAVAARTYALYRMNNALGQPFDVTSDIYSQVYGGQSAERYRTNIAVNSTHDQVMVYKGNIIPAYFHATCGGATEDARELWKMDLPPLRGVVCPFCADSPHYHWKNNFRSKEVQEKLNQYGYHLGLIKNISILERDKSGRIKTLLIIFRDGKALKIAGKNFRDILGPNLIKSNNYEIVMKGYYFDLLGRGWGHGVGMCQWGAHGMALKRYSYEDILKYYYPGTQIVDYESIRKPGAKF